MTVANKIVGTADQMVICQLEAGQTVFAEAGRFLWKTTNVSLETRLTKPPGQPGWRRRAAGQGLGGGQAGGSRSESGFPVLHRGRWQWTGGIRRHPAR
ncbi:MAG TPA: AIM24 family protein [Candidatus Dormibacteraeota bacterium]|nr:AIM24 family protein [Candidatus Dormibacteraeota bacterium]